MNKNNKKTIYTCELKNFEILFKNKEMGKFGPRLGSRKNAKRWLKGQSSSSNPETKKHREQATCLFFKDPTGIY